MKMFSSNRINSVLILIVIITSAANSSKVNKTGSVHSNSDDHPIRASQRQFIEWVLSLISQRPPFDGLITTTTTTTERMISTMMSTSTPEKNCAECTCGLANKKKRIVGGQETEVNQYPWMALLMYRTRFYCAASLINDRYVLTASHCIQGFKSDLITVRLLDHSRSTNHPNKIDRKVAEAFVHPKYNSRNFDSDIAVLRLSEPVELKDNLRPVCMPTPGKDYAGETAIVTGWGATGEGGPISDTLQEVHVPILSEDDCKRSKYGPSRITENMLCAGFEEGKKDSCQGDSGGPLHIVEGEQHQIAGVVSWGEGCAKPNYPGVYSRVSRFGSWIKSITEDACTCTSEVKKF